MKKRYVLCAALVAFGLAGNVEAAPPMKKSMENRLVKVCEALKSDSRIRLLRAIENSGVSYRQLSKGLVCNGQDAITFALNHSADKTASLFASKANVDINSMLAKR